MWEFIEAGLRACFEEAANTGGQGETGRESARQREGERDPERERSKGAKSQ